MPRAADRAPQGAAIRLAITFVTLFAFVFQTLVVQTHIHGAARIAAVAASATAQTIGGQEQQPDKFPPGDDPANCPICQELMHAGAFVAPTPAVLFVSTIATVIDVVVAEIPALTQTYAHGWNSRAPPPA